MNRFVIVGGLPYLYHNGMTYAVKWDNEGFTVGEKVELPEIPTVTHSELSVKAKCEVLCSIPAEVQTEPEQKETANDAEVQTEPEQKEVKQTRRTRKKAVKSE